MLIFCVKYNSYTNKYLRDEIIVFHYHYFQSYIYLADELRTKYKDLENCTYKVKLCDLPTTEFIAQMEKIFCLKKEKTDETFIATIYFEK